jgi:hypothetical protein
VQQVGVKFRVLTYMSMSRERNSGQNQNILIANNSPENIVKFKYCGTTLTDLNCMKEEMKERLYSGECVLPLGPESFCLPLCYPKVWRWSLTIREEHRLKASKNRVLRRISGLEMEQVTGDWRNPSNLELIICTPRFLRQDLLLCSQLITEVRNFITAKGHDHGTCNCASVLHCLFFQYPSSHYPVIRSLGLLDGCHSTGFAIAFLYPSDLLAYTYWVHRTFLVFIPLNVPSYLTKLWECYVLLTVHPFIIL